MFKWLNKLVKFTCPYCITSFSRDDFSFHCDHQDKHKINPNFWEIVPTECNCGHGVMLCVCPGCAREMPREILDKKHFSLSIFGTTSAGKSSYVTAMMYELENIEELDVSVELISTDEKARETYRTNKRTMYGGKRIDPTAECIPQIWRMQNGDRGPTYTFTIFDGPGEHSQGQSSIAEVQYVRASDAIIVTIDPVTLREACRRLDQSDYKNTRRDKISGGDPLETLHFLAQLNRTSQNKHQTLIAVVLTQFDMILNSSYINKLPNSPVNRPRPSVHNGKVNTAEIQEISKDIAYLMKTEEFGARALVRYINHNFKAENIRFFGVSSYGRAPKEDGSLYDIKPHRVLDPILWLFNKKGYIG
jgi:hypothetical protein